MPIPSYFSTWPVWTRRVLAAPSPGVVAGALSLRGCGGVSSIPNPTDPDFYIAHMNDANPIWLKSGANNPAPLTIAALPAGSWVNDLAALRFTGTLDWLYLVSTNANALVIVNKVGSNFQLVAKVPVGLTPLSLAIDDSVSFAYVSNYESNSVTVVDLSSYQPVATIALPYAFQPFGIAVTPDGKKVYVATWFKGTSGTTVSVIDAATRTITKSITVGSFLNRIAMSPNGQELYVSSSGTSTVSVIDVLSDSVSTTIPGVPNTLAAAVSPAGTELFVGQAHGSAGSVSVYDTATVTAGSGSLAT